MLRNNCLADSPVLHCLFHHFPVLFCKIRQLRYLFLLEMQNEKDKVLLFQTRYIRQHFLLSSMSDLSYFHQLSDRQDLLKLLCRNFLLLINLGHEYLNGQSFFSPHFPRTNLKLVRFLFFILKCGLLVSIIKMRLPTQILK